ncbi:hypothetical protein BGX29_009953 [Mortierella sp. GBA35]|nr:hypothetical protein BGX29_009953 [Mortierella sp. GBA35]
MLELIQWFEGKQLPSALGVLGRSSIPDEAIAQAFFHGVNTSDPAATPVQLFKDPKNHVDATSSILSFAGKSANFHPITQNPVELAKHFDAYLSKISSFPGFFLTYNEQTSIFQTSTNIDTMISDIKSAYDGVLIVDHDALVNIITQMANSVLSQSTSDESRVMFVLLGVTKANDSSEVEISIFYTTLHLKKDHSGKKTYIAQSYSINRTVFKVYTSVLVANAEMFAQKIPKVNMEEWLHANNSPNDSKVKSCFEKHYQAIEN